MKEKGIKLKFWIVLVDLYWLKTFKLLWSFSFYCAILMLSCIGVCLVYEERWEKKKIVWEKVGKGRNCLEKSWGKRKEIIIEQEASVIRFIMLFSPYFPKEEDEEEENVMCVL